MALLRRFFVLISVFLISSISQADVDSGYAWLSGQQQVDGGVYLTGDLMFDAVLSFKHLFESRSPVERKNYS